MAFCLAIKCHQLNAPENGKVLVRGMTFHSTAFLMCDKGYTLKGEVIRTCLANHSWSGRQTICEPGKFVFKSIFICHHLVLASTDPQLFRRLICNCAAQVRVATVTPVISTVDCNTNPAWSTSNFVFLIWDKLVSQCLCLSDMG